MCQDNQQALTCSALSPCTGIPRALVGHKVAVVGLRPTLPPFTPPDFRELVEQCWHQEPDKRPGFEVVLAKLVAMRQALAIVKTPPLQRYKLQTKQVAEKGNSSDPVSLEAADLYCVNICARYLQSSRCHTYSFCRIGLSTCVTQCCAPLSLLASYQVVSILKMRGSRLQLVSQTSQAHWAVSPGQS